MIIYMSDILCITNRSLCGEDFLTRIEKTAQEHPRGILLREKDLSEAEYMNLAKKVLEICRKHNILCILHSFVSVAKELDCHAIHFPLPILRTLNAKDTTAFSTLGASCHSVQEAKEAQSLGCTYITAGHIFETDCKKGLAGRGLDFLHEVCESVSIPVYAIGGIHAQNINEIRNAGASGACIMSSIMTCEHPHLYLRHLTSDKETTHEI